MAIINNKEKSVLNHSLSWLGMIFILPIILSNHANSGGPIGLYFPELRPDTYLTLYGPDSIRRTIDENDDMIPGTQLARIVRQLQGERNYYIKASVFDNPQMDDTGYYLISVQGPGGIPLEEPVEDMTELTVNGDPARNRFETENDEHWYVFRTSETGTYIIDTAFDPEHGAEGIPPKWTEFPVMYNIDKGPLGEMKHEKAVELVQSSIEVWNKIETTSARLERGNDLEFDFNLEAFGPQPRLLPALFYDPVRENILLFGGSNQTIGLLYSDLWEWDGENWKVISLEDHPSGRDSFGSAYDRERKELIIFGGTGGGPNDLSDTWSWDGESWSRQSPDQNPPARNTLAMAYDEARKQVVLFGGMAEDEILGDTWVWDGENWSEKQLTVNPPARAGHQMIFDPVRQTVIMFSGFGEEGNPLDFWEWDGEKWSEISFQNGPAARDSYTFSKNAGGGEVLLFGGYDEDANRLNDTWVWDGNTWTELSPANRPSKRQLHAMAYDEGRNEVVLFGGEDSRPQTWNDEIFGDTWIWDGTSWEQKSDSSSYTEVRDKLFNEGVNPVIFDQNGDIVDLLHGVGARDNIRGFAGPQIIEGSDIQSGWAVINGYEVDNSISQLEELISFIIAHEFGHFLGLGHAQFYGHLNRNAYGPDDAYYPLMYWKITSAEDFFFPILHYDDEIALTRLYPKENDILERDLGTITGRAVFSDGRPVPGAMIAARLVDDRYETVVGTQTDTNEALTGRFELAGLPPGDYEVWIEPVDPDSGVSIHTTVTKQYPVRPEYYSGNDESGEENLSLVSIVEVQAGEKTEIELICEPLTENNELNTQILGYGSPMLGGFGETASRSTEFPFLVDVDDSIDDLTLAVEMFGDQTAFMEVEFEDELIYDSSTTPGKRDSAAMAFDSARGFSLLFGGKMNDRFRNDLWGWDGNQWTLFTPDTLPPPRSEHAIAFDPGRGKLVLFGGANETELLGDTWEWDGNDWTEIITGNSPPARVNFNMVYDANRQKIVLFGGGGSESLLNDTWEFDGVQWTQIETEEVPIPRWYPAMTYDPVRQNIILFGGGYDEGRLNDTWEFDGTQWVEIETEHAPAPRAGQTIVYDTNRENIVLFAGRTEAGRLNDMWEYDGQDWTQISLSNPPSGRSPSLQLTFDAIRERIVLYGGLSAEGGQLSDTWEYNGNQWNEISTSSTQPARNLEVTFNRNGDNGRFALQNGDYFIRITNAGEIPGQYSITASSSSIDYETNVDSWEVY